MKPATLTLFLVLAGLAAPALAATLHVPSEYPTIQAGIDAAVSGTDEVVVADGTYSGPGNQDIDFRGKAITVRSENGPDVCIVDGGGQGANHRGFLFQTGETSAAVLEGITIRNSWKSFAHGGGIYINGASPVITNCRLAGNVADGTGEGGGIYANGSSARITGCVITGNAAGGYHGFGAGGGVRGVNSTLIIENCTVAENLCGGYQGAGGLDLSGGSVTRTIIWGNCGVPFGEVMGLVVLTCCAVDPNDCSPGVEFDGPQVYSDPLFCDPRSCFPHLDGDYGLQAGSPCLPEASPCGELIGALDEGCGGVPVDEMSWGQIKARYR